MQKLLAPFAVATVLLAACAPNQGPRYSDNVIDRALAGAAGAAQPSRIVATEIAFSRAAREDGQWTAFREFAADGAVLHGRGGPIEAKPWLAAQDDPSQAVQWGPRSVWMSCDGGTAVSQGRFRDPAGQVGTFVTVWERQRSDGYRWVYDAGAPDNPQPPPRRVADPPSEDEIVVSGESPIIGLVADCRRGEGAATAPPALSIPDGIRHGAMLSRDGTLRWHWEHGGADARRVVVEYWKNGAWETALDHTFAAQPPASPAG